MINLLWILVLSRITHALIFLTRLRWSFKQSFFSDSESTTYQSEKKAVLLSGNCHRYSFIYVSCHRERTHKALLDFLLLIRQTCVDIEEVTQLTPWSCDLAEKVSIMTLWETDCEKAGSYPSLLHCVLKLLKSSSRVTFIAVKAICEEYDWDISNVWLILNVLIALVESCAELSAPTSKASLDLSLVCGQWLAFKAFGFVIVEDGNKVFGVLLLEDLLRNKIGSLWECLISCSRHWSTPVKAQDYSLAFWLALNLDELRRLDACQTKEELSRHLSF